MRYLQRPIPTETTPRKAVKLWQPEQAAPDGRRPFPIPTPEASDDYVTVDERVEGVIAVVISRWPSVTTRGLLSFPGRPTTSWFAEDKLQAALDKSRERAKQVTRPLRIGDTFWVRGWSRKTPGAWDDLLDITPAARQAAKAALAAAIGDYRPDRRTPRPHRGRPAPAAEPEPPAPPCRWPGDRRPPDHLTGHGVEAIATPTRPMEARRIHQGHRGRRPRLLLLQCR